MFLFNFLLTRNDNQERKKRYQKPVGNTVLNGNELHHYPNFIVHLDYWRVFLSFCHSQGVCLSM